MTQQISVETDRFWRDGYLLIKEVFSPQEISALRTQSHKVIEKQKKAGLTGTAGNAATASGELLAQEDLRQILLDDRILAIGKQILGDKLIYFGDSTFQVGTGLRGWHRDNRIPDRFTHSASDWTGRYDLIRFGVYLQDHAHHSGGLGIRVGSHNPSSLVKALEKVPPARMRVWASAAHGKPISVASEIGDVVVWTLRTTHSGNVVRLKPLPNMKFGSWLENRAPAWLRVEEEDQRVALFFTLGVDGDHMRRYIEYLKTRDYMVKSWQQFQVAPEVIEEARRKDLKVLNPVISVAR